MKILYKLPQYAHCLCRTLHIRAAEELVPGLFTIQTIIILTIIILNITIIILTINIITITIPLIIYSGGGRGAQYPRHPPGGHGPEEEGG